MSSDTTWRPPDTGPRPQPQRPPAGPTARRRPSTGGSTLAMPAAGALACICASTAISGVVGGLGWLSYVVVVVVVVVATGAALRALRVPAPVIWIGQVFVLLCLAVTLFTATGVFVVLPGPAALHDLGVVFGQAGSEVQTGVPPVNADQPILCLVMLSMGLVAVAVDMLAVTARVPAAAGLILLCVYAVPASLDDAMLPWWSFALGACAFTFMLAVDGVQRHQQWRGKLGLPSVATTGVAPATTALTALGLVVALFIGGTFTFVGTVGRLPGGAGNGDVAGQLGIKPFTVLSGMLDQKATSELFDVSGLPSTPPYLQALTLDTYQAGRGWVVGTQMPPGVQADGPQPLPEAPGQLPKDALTTVQISGVNWADVWLPIFGMPSSIQGVSSDYRYDKDSGIVYSTSTRKPGNYTEKADLTVPTADALEGAGSDYSGVSAKYRQLPHIDPQVVNLAETITSSAGTEFDMAQDLYNYFRSPANGFTYSTQTKPPVTGDPLVDFLFHGKTGFCEQYASAMAVMLRVLGIPARIGIGFTDGYQSDGHRVITSADAHAWVEVYFPNYGWVTFDPTPLTDGRTQETGYVGSTNTGAQGLINRQNPDKPNGKPGTVPTQTAAKPATITPATTTHQKTPSGPPIWLLSTVLSLLAVAVVSLLLALGLIGGRRPRPMTAESPDPDTPSLDDGDTARPPDPDAPPTGRDVPLRGLWLTTSIVAWPLAAFFAAALVSWWLSVLVAVLGIAAAPAGVREWRRRHRHRVMTRRGPGAADAAWDELLAESWDRGTEVERGDTVRTTANRMARVHGLDSQGRQGLQTLVGEVERSWYGVPGSATPVVAESFDSVRNSMHRMAPLPWQARLLPRSVLRPMRTPAADEPTETDDEDSDS